MKLPRIVIAAPKSGSGKTLITISLMKAFLNRGIKIAGFKCGPDYIDPMFHKKVLGIPSKNLDLFFTDEKTTRSIFASGNEARLSIIEGVMGLYDGLDAVKEEASTYHLAKTLEAPVILVIDAKGMGRSVIAEIQGFLSLDTEKLIKGVILNNISKSLCEKLAPLVSEVCKIPVFGCFPNQKDLQIESRHLGLKLPEEIENLKEITDKAAERISKTVDLDEILKIADSADDFTKTDFITPATQKPSFPVRIAVAKDEAFCFYYEDNLKLLECFGAEIVEFSPIHDNKLPSDISGLIFGGGYPEFYAEKLSKNTVLIEEIRNKIEQGLPSLAECGGFMYLHKTLKNQSGNVYKMAGVIDADTFYTGKLVRFGYISLENKISADAGDDSFFTGCIKGHEFHYFDSTQNGDSFTAIKTNGKKYDLALSGKNHFWSFAHLYYPSNPDFAKAFVEQCRLYWEERNE